MHALNPALLYIMPAFLQCIAYFSLLPTAYNLYSTGGIDERVYTILALCHEKTVPVVFAMSRRRLAAVLKKKFKMGCVGIFSYDGAEVMDVACSVNYLTSLRYR